MKRNSAMRRPFGSRRRIVREGPPSVIYVVMADFARAWGWGKPIDSQDESVGLCDQRQ